MCIREKKFGDTVFFSLHGRTNAMRSQGEVTETQNVSQNWLTSHSCNSGHVASPTQRENNNKTHALMCKFPGYKTTSVKKCPLTKNCSCCGYSQIISCCTGVVGTCGLHIRNIQVLFITGKISFITRTPRNCRCWVSFHFTFKWYIPFTANKDFLCKYNLWRNCNELKTTTTKQIFLIMNENILFAVWFMFILWNEEVIFALLLPGQFKQYYCLL